jgi:hypothetical protein
VQSGRTLVELTAGLPEESLQSLWNKGYLKWRFSARDDTRKQQITQVQTSLLTGYMGDSERMKATAQRMNELAPQMLESADLGLVVMDAPESKVQIVAWYFIYPHVAAPTMLPIFGKASPKDDSLQQQLEALNEKSYTNTPRQ